MEMCFLGLTIALCIQCTYGIFGRKITKYTVYTAYIYGSGQPYRYVQGWPNLCKYTHVAHTHTYTHTHARTHTHTYMGWP